MSRTQAQARAEADTAALQAELEQESAARQRLDDMLTAAEAVSELGTAVLCVSRIARGRCML